MAMLHRGLEHDKNNLIRNVAERGIQWIIAAAVMSPLRDNTQALIFLFVTNTFFIFLQ